MSSQTSTAWSWLWNELEQLLGAASAERLREQYRAQMRLDSQRKVVKDAPRRIAQLRNRIDRAQNKDGKAVKSWQRQIAYRERLIAEAKERGE